MKTIHNKTGQAININGTPLENGEAVYIHESFIQELNLKEFKKIEKGNTVIISKATGKKENKKFDVNDIWVYPEKFLTKDGVLTKNKMYKAQILFAQEMAKENKKTLIDKITFDKNTTEANIQDFYMPLSFIGKE